MAIMSDLERAREFAQKALADVPVIILGSGASAAHGVPGMWPLGRYLKQLPVLADWTSDESHEWAAFCAHLDGGKDLEAALEAVRLSERQTNGVADATRTFLLPADLKAFDDLLKNRRAFPLTRLYQHLFQSIHKTLDVITPNYDRLAEYAADAGDFSHFTGFGYGHLQTRARDPGTRVHAGREAARTVCVWKVHGSLDWFRDEAGQIVGARACHTTPAGYSPVMVTPGIDKYRLTHGEPFRTIFSCSDIALERARAYLCVGYGFNDEHVQTKLVERCEVNGVPLVVVTKQLTPTAKAFLARGKCRKYLAFEESPTGTRAYSNINPDGIDLPHEELWRFDKFLDLMLGDAT
ncbi:MAG: hypothetical protein FD144_5220 [Rhodospirillaceae bacterium]|nr:MAG: hypothetical protein FD144_5220 [Rhodospirillaceae bacterium]